MAEQTNSTVKLVSTDMFEVELPEIPTSGYRWQLDEDNQAAIIVDQSFEEPERQKLAGAIGKRKFKLKALKPPPFTLRFIKKRAWETKFVEEHHVEVSGD